MYNQPGSQQYPYNNTGKMQHPLQSPVQPQLLQQPMLYQPPQQPAGMLMQGQGQYQPPQQPGMQQYPAVPQLLMHGTQGPADGAFTPDPLQVKALRPGPFSSSLLGCFGDCSICWLGFFLPCCLYGDNYARVHGQGFWGACLLYFICPVLSCIFASDTRKAIRTKYNLHEEPCSDCWVHCGCSWCAICQESQELKARCNVISTVP